MHACPRRLQYEPHRIMFSDVREEAESGKLVILDWHDKRGNAMVVMTPRLQNTADTEQQMRYLVYIMERASQRTDAQGMHIDDPSKQLSQHASSRVWKNHVAGGFRGLLTQKRTIARRVPSHARHSAKLLP